MLKSHQVAVVEITFFLSVSFLSRFKQFPNKPVHITMLCILMKIRNVGIF